jgi:dolichyl-phosphate-mannose--protein O-mannosyl transferase
MFYGAKTSGVVILILVCLIPAAATLLAILAGIYACFSSRRRFSLVLAFGCLIIYAVIVAWFLLTGAHHSFVQFLDAMPAGRFFRTFIPFVAATAIVYFDLRALKKDRQNGDHEKRGTKIPEIRKPESEPEPRKMNPIGKLPLIRK